MLDYNRVMETFVYKKKHSINICVYVFSRVVHKVIS